MNKSVKVITGFLGISMFMFGVLKFVNPFKNWYSQQIFLSDFPLPILSYWMGQLGEIIVGVAFIFLLFNHKKISSLKLNLIFNLGNFSIIIMMLVAFYVHAHPNVPADVLPLKISPPYIPGFFLLLAIANIYFKTKTIVK